MRSFTNGCKSQLPFSVPIRAEKLFNYGPDVFGPFISASLPSSKPVTPLIDSFASRRPSATHSPVISLHSTLASASEYTDTHRFIPVLPDGFLEILDAARMSASFSRSTRRPLDDTISSVGSTLGKKYWSRWREDMPDEDDDENFLETPKLGRRAS